MPGPRCSVCAHPDLAQIDGALLNGSSQRAVARAYGTSSSAVQRHVAEGHVSELLTAVSKQVEAVGHEQLISQAVNLYERSLALLVEAEHAQSQELRIKALGQVRGNLELLSKLALSAPPTGHEGGERPDLDAAIARLLHARTQSEPTPEQGKAGSPNEGQPNLTPRALPPGRGGGGSTSSPQPGRDS